MAIKTYVLKSTGALDSINAFLETFALKCCCCGKEEVWLGCIWPRSHWTPHWSPCSRKGRSRPREAIKGDQSEISSSGNARAIRIWPCNFNPTPEEDQNCTVRSSSGVGLKRDLIILVDYWAIKSLVGMQRAIRHRNLLAKQCSFEPTFVPKKGGINARSYSRGNTTAISRLQLILLRDPDLATLDPVGTRSMLFQ